MLKRLYVHNFRCLENFTLDLGDRSSALLIGKNGSGKSTVLQSLKVLQAIGRGAARVSDLISKEDFTRGQLDQPIRFQAELNLAGHSLNYEVAFEWSANSREPRILEESLAADGTPAFIRLQSEVRMDAPVAFSIDSNTFALPVIYSRRIHRTFKDVKAFFAGMMLVAPTPSTMAGFSEEATWELQYDGANFASCLRALLGQKPAAYGAVHTYIKSVLPDFYSLEHVDRGERGQQLVVKFEDRASLSVDFGALSDGEKCFFLSALIVAANSAGNPVFCAWDEPDNHLSLSEVGQFILSLRKRLGQGGQFIATTHHPETIRKFSDDTTFVFTRKSHLEPTVVRPLADYSYSGDLIHALMRDEIIG